MDYRLIFLGLAGALLSVAFAQTRQYYFVNQPKTWTAAQTECRQNYTDLATIESIADVNAVISISPISTGQAWIGLYDDLYNSWKWSLNNDSFYGVQGSTFRNWISGSPNNFGGQQYCVRLLSDPTHQGGWDDRQCNDSRRFLCYSGMVNGSPTYFVSTSSDSRNWTDAQAFCRKNYTDLASIRNQAENDNIKNLLGGIEVWIGLYREKLWSDGSTSLFQYWAAGRPVNSYAQCVAAEFSDSGRWFDNDCTQTHPFICYRTIPPNAGGFIASGQNETSITLQWNQVNNVSFVLQFNGTETNISSPTGDGPVAHTVSSLTAGTEYTFTLFSVLNNVKSSGITITVATAPPNPEGLKPSGLDETSITLQWSKINTNISFVLQFNGSETNISAPTGDGPVTFTVSSLTARTKYTFTLFSVFENIRSSGVTITATTGPSYVLRINLRLRSSTDLSKFNLEDVLTEIFRTSGLSSESFSLKIVSVRP